MASSPSQPSGSQLSTSQLSTSQPRASRPVGASAIEQHVYKVFPNDMNSHHTVFGGMIMSKCDRLALVVAERHSGRVCVTAAVDSIHFRAPAKGNDTLLFSLSLNRSWGSSMEIGARVEAENSYTGDSRHILSAFFTFVALDENDKPIDVPAVTPETEDQKRRFRNAEIRREGRLKTRKKLNERRSGPD